MANYATITDVNALTPQSPFTASSSPTQAQVEQFITEINTIMNASLRNLGYVVPVDVVLAPLSGVILKRLCSAGAMGMSAQAQQTGVSPDQAIQTNVWMQRYDKWMKALCDNKDPFELPDAARTSRAVVKPLGLIQSDATVAGVDSGTAQDANNYLTDPPFRMGQVL